MVKSMSFSDRMRKANELIQYQLVTSSDSLVTVAKGPLVEPEQLCFSLKSFPILVTTMAKSVEYDGGYPKI